MNTHIVKAPSIALICLLGILMFISMVAYSEQQLLLAPGQKYEISVPNEDPAIKARYLWIKGRLCSREESWGAYGLKISINGQAMEWRPLNKLPSLPDFSNPLVRKTSFVSPFDKQLFLRSDTDFVPYNAVGTNKYNRRDYLYDWNYRRAFVDAHYVYAFKLPTISSEDNTVIQFANISKKEKISLSIGIMPQYYDRLFFQASSGLIVYEWTFPWPDEILSPSRGLKVNACPGQYVSAVLSAAPVRKPENYKISVTDLKSEKCIIPSKEIDIRVLSGTLKPTNVDLEFRGCAGATYDEFQRLNGMTAYPDRLLSSSEWAVLANKATSVWFIIKTPEEASAGVYKGMVTLLNEDGTKTQLPLTLNVRPFIMDESGITFGLWDNLLPGKYDSLTKERIADLKAHGINAITVDICTSPIRISLQNGNLNIDTENLERTMRLLKNNGLNNKIFPLLGIENIFKQLKKLSEDKKSALNYETASRKFIDTLQKLGIQLGLEMYFHPLDEPDIHRGSIPKYIKYCNTIRKVSGAKIWSNNTVFGMKKFKGLYDLNCAQMEDVILAYLNMPARKSLVPDNWEMVSSRWIKENVKQAYIQVRSTRPDYARRMFGIITWYTNLKGMWGFAYSWNIREGWYIAWPFPEHNGKLGTTLGWEMLRQGIYDYRMLKTFENLLSRKMPRTQARKKIKSILPPFEKINVLTSQEMDELIEMVARHIEINLKNGEN